MALSLKECPKKRCLKKVSHPEIAFSVQWQSVAVFNWHSAPDYPQYLFSPFCDFSSVWYQQFCGVVLPQSVMVLLCLEFTQPSGRDSRWKGWQESSPNFANFAAFGWFMWGVGCHMGGADQDMKFANSLSGEEGRRRRWQTSINLCRKLTPGIPFGDSLSVRASFLYRSESL